MAKEPVVEAYRRVYTVGILHVRTFFLCEACVWSGGAAMVQMNVQRERAVQKGIEILGPS